MTQEPDPNTYCGTADTCSLFEIVTEIELFLEKDAGQSIVYAMCLLSGSPALTTEFFIEGGSMYEVLFANTPYAHALQASPYYRLTEPGTPFTQYLCEEHPVGFGWFTWGAGSLEASATHWRSLLTVQMPDGVITHFRHYSASVMADCIQGCSAKEITLLLGPLAGIAVPLPDGTWLCVEHPALADHSAQDIARQHVCRDAPWWKVNDAQLQALESNVNTTLVHNIRLDAWQNHPQWVEPFDSFNDLDSFITSGLKGAKDWGFSGAEQQTAFARLCLASNTISLESIPECGRVLHSAQLSNTSKLDNLSQILGVTPWPA